MYFAPYDQIAGEYYNDFHKTCRNFDETTLKAIESIRTRIPKDGLILDIGCGRGRCIEYLSVESNRIIQLDNSLAMLKLSPREDCLIRILHEAEQLPFLDMQFACVTSFLCDTFFGLNFLAEAFRVLNAGGLFLSTMPSFEWGTALRRELSIDSSETRFKTIAGSEIRVPSVLVSTNRLVAMLEKVGFDGSQIEVQKHKLPEGISPISDDITIAADKLKCSVNDLDLVYLIIASK
jgi:SAM-dependent methyltransferase